MTNTSDLEALAEMRRDILLKVPYTVFANIRREMQERKITMTGVILEALNAYFDRKGEFK